MKSSKTVLAIIIIGLVAFASACSPGVSLQEYEKATSQAKAAQADLASLQQKYSSLEKQLADLKTENENLKAEVARLKQTPSPSTTPPPKPTPTVTPVPSPTPTPTPTATAPADVLQILSHTMNPVKLGNLVVSGTAKNISPNKLKFAEIRIRFTDLSGKVLKTSSATTADLAPGATWNFEVTYPGTDTSAVFGYQIEVGSVY